MEQTWCGLQRFNPETLSARKDQEGTHMKLSFRGWCQKRKEEEAEKAEQ